MGINFAPQNQPTANNELITAVAASTTAATVNANPDRLGGYLVNTANKDLWVKFGDPTKPALLAAALPFTKVPMNANLDIPDDYVGPIGLIWAVGVNANGQAIVHEMIP